MVTGGLVSVVPLRVGRNMFRCLLADSGGSVMESKPAVVKGVIEMSIWPTRSRARIDLSNSLVELGVSGGSVDSWHLDCEMLESWKGREQKETKAEQVLPVIASSSHENWVDQTDLN